MKALSFKHPCKLKSKPATAAWMLAEHTRLLGQKQRTSLHTGRVVARVMAFSCVGSLSPNSHRPGDTCTDSEGTSQERRNLKLREPDLKQWAVSAPDCTLS